MATDTNNTRRRRAWQRMLSGRRLDVLDPTPMDVEIEDIAHGLSRLARWNGQTKGEWAWSVAQHALLVESLLCHANPTIAAPWRQAALLHDAAEYVIGDIITPLKFALGAGYENIEVGLIRAIHIRFGLPATLPRWAEVAINKADRTAAYLEAIHLAGFTEAEATGFIAAASIAKAAPLLAFQSKLVPKAPDVAKADYLKAFAHATALADGASVSIK